MTDMTLSELTSVARKHLIQCNGIASISNNGDDTVVIHTTIKKLDQTIQRRIDNVDWAPFRYKINFIGKVL